MTPRAQRAVEMAARAITRAEAEEAIGGAFDHLEAAERSAALDRIAEKDHRVALPWARAALIAALIELATQEDGRHIWAYLDNLLSDLKGA
jgi:hypothetical protein